MSQFHKPGEEKRMVVILNPAQYDGSLQGDLMSSEEVHRPYPAEHLIALPDPLPPR